MARVIVIGGANRGLRFDLTAERTSIGRDYSNQIQINDSKSSRHHAEIIKENNSWLLMDLGSSNGTKICGKQVKSSPLKNHDEIQIGDTVMEFVDEVERLSPALVDTDELDGLGNSFETVSIDRNTLIDSHDALNTASMSDVQKNNDRLIKLYELAAMAAEANTIEGLYDQLSPTVIKELEVDRFYFILKKSASKWDVIGSSETQNPIARSVAKAPISQTILKSVAKKQEPSLINVSNDAELAKRKSIKMNSVSTVLAVPLIARGEFLGVLYADRISGGENFGREDLEFLDAAGNYIALSLNSIKGSIQLGQHAERLIRDSKREHQMLGESDMMKNVFDLVERIAPTDAGVLVLGESGTGKELVARAIHESSLRQDKAFEIVNCAALSESLIESELFGHAKGAYTGATSDRPGRFELADGGSIFLDEIGELSASMQTKLLRVLEQGESIRVGEAKLRHVDVRVVAATNRNLELEVSEGRFRADLYYRLNVMRIELPPLSARLGDIKLLTEHYVNYFASATGRADIKLKPEVIEKFESYPWPGNVRELKNVVERLCVLVSDDTVTLANLPLGLFPKETASSTTNSAIPTMLKLADVEREHIARVLELTQGNKKKAAELLGIDRSTLYAKLKD